MLLFAVVLIGIGRMHFSLTALQEPGFLKRAVRTWPSTSSFAEPAVMEFHRHR
jgi:hypothetical protein